MPDGGVSILLRPIPIMEVCGHGKYASTRRHNQTKRSKFLSCRRLMVLRFRIVPLSHHPGRDARLKLQYCFDVESGGRHSFSQLIFRVSAKMPELFIQRIVNTLPGGNQNHRAAAVLEHARMVSQSLPIVFNVLQNIQANHGVHLALKGRVIFWNCGIQLRDFQVRPMRKPVAETLQMFAVDVGGHISLSSRQELPGQIAHPRADLEDVLPM
jgi:hypothetical protein